MLCFYSESLGPRVTGMRLYAKQALAIIIKRFIFNYRNMRGLATQILLPAFFITVAMTVALTAPGFADPPPMTLSTSMFSRMNSLYTPVSGLNTFKMKNVSQVSTLNANSFDFTRVLQYPSGLGSTCLLKDPFMNQTQLSFDDLTGLSCHDVYWDKYNSYSMDDINWAIRSTNNQTYFNHTLLPIPSSKNKFYIPCACSESQSRFICPTFPRAPSQRLISNDRLMNISTEDNEILYYLYTSDYHHLDRYGGLSFGLVQDYVPDFYPTDKNQSFLHKLAVKNTARIFTNHKGYHALPIYLNAMSNIILRANLPPEKGLPSAYGITTINRMYTTCYNENHDQNNSLFDRIE